ncbi:MAG TPA: putative Ig domain-containing protein [Abditibacteriaceae bacterium]|jgi:hypothetical protein
MKLLRFALVVLAVWAFICGLSSPLGAQTPTYKTVPLDTGGWVSGFAQHASGRLYGYGDTFGVYRSDDFGANWRYLQNSLTENGSVVYGLAVSPTDANRVAFLGATGLWNSTDGGEMWTKRLADITAATWDPDFLRTRGAKPLVYHPSQTDELWMAATRRDQSGSLWRTRDNGLTWSAVGGATFVKEQVTTIHFFPDAPNEVWVGTAAYADRRQMGGLWCSVDSGVTWRKVWDNNGNRNRMGAPPLVSSIARNVGRVSVIATNVGIWQITATDWKDPQTYVATQRAFADQKIPNVTTLADGTFWASEIGDTASAPKVSADGTTWTDRPISLSSTSVPEWLSKAQIAPNRLAGRDMLVQDVKNPARWLLTGFGSAHLSEDNGLTWRYQPGGMAGLRGFRVDFDRTHSGRAYLATSDRGIFVINDGGLTGKTAQSSNRSFGELHTFHETMVSADGQTLIAAGVRFDTNRTVLIRSTDAGATWTKITTRGLAESVEGVTHAVMSLDDPQDFLVVNGAPIAHGWGYHDMGPGGGAPNSPGIYRTTDGGANFVHVGGAAFEGLDTGMSTRPEYLFLERDGINSNVRYLALRAPNKAPARGVWRSDDGGTSWTLRSNPFPGQWDSIATFSVDPTVEGRLWAGGSRLRRSDDGGDSWNDVTDFSSVTSVSSHGGRIAVLGRRGEEAFNSIYASVDNGATWQEMTSPTNRLGWAQNVTVDPWRARQIWVGGSRAFEIINPPATALFTPPVAAPSNAQPLPTLAGLVGKSLRYRIRTSGYPVPTFAITKGKLPAGLKLNATTGEILGTPTSIADSNIAVQATNSKGKAIVPLKLAITLGPRLAVNLSPRYFQLANTTGTLPITLTNSGNAPLSWATKQPDAPWLTELSPKEGTLAAGASVVIQAAIKTDGIADAQTRTANLAFTSNDPTSRIRNVALNLTVGATPLPPVIAAGQSVTASKGGILSYSLKATNVPYRWALALGRLPQGVTLDATTGVLSGTPMAAGVFRAEFTATNGGGTSAVQAFTLTIVPPALGTNYDFNVSQAHFEETFTRNGGWPWRRTAGIGESGGLETDSNHHVAILRDAAITFTTAGQSIKLGVSFKARAEGGTAGGDALRLGLGSDHTPWGNADSRYLQVGPSKADTLTLASALSVYSRSGGASSSTSDTKAIPLIDKNWYALDATITYDGQSNFTVVTSLSDLGATGTTKPVLLGSYTGKRTGLTGLVNVPLYAGFQGRNTNSSGGVRAFDDFSARKPAELSTTD